MSKHDYPSQQNRVRLPWVGPGYDSIARNLAQAWSAETGRHWSVKDVLEALLDLANEGEVRPIVARVKKVE